MAQCTLQKFTLVKTAIKLNFSKAQKILSQTGKSSPASPFKITTHTTPPMHTNKTDLLDDHLLCEGIGQDALYTHSDAELLVVYL